MSRVAGRLLLAISVATAAVAAIVAYVLLFPGGTEKPRAEQVAFLAATSEIRSTQAVIEEFAKINRSIVGSGKGRMPTASRPVSDIAVLGDGDIIAKVELQGEPARGGESFFLLFSPMLQPDFTVKWRCRSVPERLVGRVCE